jgi:hypoxanthine phosphoribosyltransferase
MEKINRKYSWDHFHRYCFNLAYEIKQEESLMGRKYKYIYGIPRGGLIPATILSHILEVPVVDWTQLGSKTISEVLVVDDIVDSGGTIKKFEMYDTATIFYKDKVSDFVPTFFAHYAEEEDWIVFPWECSTNDPVSQVNKGD